MTDRPEEQQNDLLKDPAFLRGLTDAPDDAPRPVPLGRRRSRCPLAGCHPGRVWRDQRGRRRWRRHRRRHGGGGGDGGIDWNAEPNGTLNFANWPLYIDKAKVNGQVTYPSLDDFTAATGIDVKYRESINSNEGFFGKIQPQLAAGQSTGWDIIVITNGTTLDTLLRLNYLVPLPTDKRPNFDANASVAVTDPAYDPGNAFTMAWQSGLTGIGWDPEQVKSLRPSKPEITSVMDLFDPAFEGKVGMFNNSADLAGLVMVGQGVDPATSTPGRVAGGRGSHAAAEGRRGRPRLLRPELHERAPERRPRGDHGVVRRPLPDEPRGRRQRAAVLHPG